MFQTDELPGTGGLLKTTPEDFLVEELPAYAPSGEGTHAFLLIEKRALNTPEAIALLCRALGARASEAGFAGMKDRQAVARQWISLAGVDPARARGLERGGVRVLAAERHGHKLRTGHLHGNRFTVTLRGTTDGVVRARAILDAIARLGLANFFGAQRFGARGDNAARGRALLAGERLRVDRAERRLLISAYQSLLFNRYLARRLAAGELARALEGDVLKKCDSGGLFVVGPAEIDAAQQRLDARAVVVTGPMFGHKMLAPPCGSAAATRERQILDEEGLDADAFLCGPLAEGTRRPLVASVTDGIVRPGDEPGAIVLTFALPPGAYATVLLGEVCKGQDRAAASVE